MVIDASAAVEYLLQTDIGVRVGSILGELEIAAPELLDAEVMAVLRRESLAGRLPQRRAAEAIEDLRDWGVVRVSHRELLDEAWLLRGRLSAYDALYVAVARTRNYELITADGPLSRAPGLGIPVYNVRLT